MLKPVTHWNLRRLKTTYAEIEAALLKNVAPSPETLERLAHVGEMPEALRERSATESGRVVGHVMHIALARGRVHWPQLSTLQTLVEKDLARAGLGGELIAYLAGVRALQQALGLERSQKGTEDDVRSVRTDLSEALGAVERRYPEARSLKILRAGVVSLDDRAAAADLYAEATAAGWAGMASSVYDLGAQTYLSGPEVWSRRRVSDEALPREAVLNALSGRPAPYNRAWVNLVWSVDPGFLRIYGPMWFNLAPYLLNDGIGMIFVVAGEPGARDQAVAEARELITRMADYRILPGPERYGAAVAFIGVDVPEWVGEAKTFYASARYLAAPAILEATERPVMILDADQTLREPLGPYVRRLMKMDAGITRSRGLALMWPWRRNMAGTAFFNATPGGQALLTKIGHYITAGLGQDPSWTLDQNALAFAMESAGEAAIADLNATARPLHQDRIRTVFEKTWRDGPPTPP